MIADNLPVQGESPSGLFNQPSDPILENSPHLVYFYSNLLAEKESESQEEMKKSDDGF